MPAFEGEIAAPPRLDVLEPDLDRPLDVDRAAPFTLRWRPEPGHDVFMELVSGGVTIACSASDDAGEIVVPTELLELLPRAGGMMGGMLMVSRAARRSLPVGDGRVTLEALATECVMGSVD